MDEDVIPVPEKQADDVEMGVPEADDPNPGKPLNCQVQLQCKQS